MSIFTQKTTTKQQVTAQANKCKKLVKDWIKSDNAKEAVRDQLVVIFGDYLKKDADHSKAFKLAVAQFLAHVGYDDIKSLCEGENIRINSEFSMLKKVSGLLVDCNSFKDVRKAYDADRAARSQASGGKSAKSAKSGKSGSASTAAPVADTPNEPNLQAPQMVGALLEEFNKLSQMDNIAQHRVAELIKEARKELHKEAQEALKIAKAKKAA